MSLAARHKVYVDGPLGVRVPFTEVVLEEPHAPVRIYDTSGPGSDPTAGLPPLRAAWIDGRGDTEEYEGRAVQWRDDGRRGLSPDAFAGAIRPPRRALPGRCVTQLHYARRGEITPEMEFVAVREQASSPHSCATRWRPGRAIIPANINHPESEPMAIGRGFS